MEIAVKILISIIIGIWTIATIYGCDPKKDNPIMFILLLLNLFGIIGLWGIL